MEQENEYQIRNKESQKTIYKKYTQEPSKFMTLALLWVKFRIAYRGYFFKILRFKCVCVCVRELNRVYLGNTNNVIPDPVNNNGEITHLEPDILECKVKWALESITTNKASGGDGIPVELFQILKDDAVKVLHSICWQIWKTQQWPQDWKRSVFIPIPKKGNAKECSNYHTIARISLASKVMLKILQVRLQ